ncbi:hypothetical protein T484DRAFT_1845215 [Baffinella frigidus]|nr:hypothetical protein T484DRAFT_1845215 [Cryptophyta sp. CCMP2293]
MRLAAVVLTLLSLALLCVAAFTPSPARSSMEDISEEAPPRLRFLLPTELPSAVEFTLGELSVKQVAVTVGARGGREQPLFKALDVLDACSLASLEALVAPNKTDGPQYRLLTPLGAVLAIAACGGDSEALAAPLVILVGHAGAGGAAGGDTSPSYDASDHSVAGSAKRWKFIHWLADRPSLVLAAMSVDGSGAAALKHLTFQTVLSSAREHMDVLGGLISRCMPQRQFDRQVRSLPSPHRSL